MSNILRKFGRGREDSSQSIADDSRSSMLMAPEYGDDGNLSDSSYTTVQTQRSGPLLSLPHRRRKSDADVHARAATSGPRAAEGPAASASANPLGLNLLYNPEESNLDFIFVHGLGGSSVRTWSHQRDPRNFWPMWLGREPGLSGARIFSFGYNSNFRGASTVLNITDFAKDLLLRMCTFSEGSSEVSDSRVGKNPIVFVAHSMGGLVVKKAYILGKHDHQYSEVMSKVQAIAFLATPHRGSQYAKILNNILDASPFGTSKKEYVTQLETSSSALQDINDQFRVHCGDLILISFYETIKTQLVKGVTKIVVEKSSAVLDYPQELSSPLNADHHNMCKFENPYDENYMCVRNMLKLVASRLSPKKARVEMPSTTAVSTKHLEEILGISESPDNEFTLFRERLSEGSCQWILYKQSFRDWAEGSLGPDIFWLTGPPAGGKSTLSAFVIDWIRSGFLNNTCQHHFFVSDHQVKRTAKYCLQAIAFQLAHCYKVVQDALLQLHDETGVAFGDQSVMVIWERIFEGIVFRVPLPGKLYLVLDAMDEAEGATNLCNMLLKARSVNRIKIFITSRKTKELTNILNAHQSRITHETLTSEDTSQDIRAHVSQTVRAYFRQDKDTQEVVQQILDRADGNFLWVKLTLETIRDSWHTQDDIRKALSDLPEGMEPLYKQMLKTVRSQVARIREMAQEILTWAVCSFRPLSIRELEAALLPKFGGFVNLEDTIGHICGQFIHTSNGQIGLVHATARQFLLSNSDGFISKHNGHDHLALACLQYLSDDSWRRVFSLGPRGAVTAEKMNLSHYADEHPFLNYAVQHWAYHVHNASCNNDELLETLEEFFQTHVLAWIHGVVLSGNLRTLSRAAQYIRGFVHRKVRSRSEASEPPITLRVQDVSWLRLWATDLIRIMGRFGRILQQEPKSIYRLIPIMCPEQSRIGLTYGRAAESDMSLSGLSSATWDDCLSRVGGSEDDSISQVIATEAYFLTLYRVSGKAVVWSTETCEELRRMSHGEYVTHMALNKRGTRLVTAGVRTIRTWELSTGKEIYCFARDRQAKTTCIAFGDLDTTLIIGQEDYSLQSRDIESGAVTSTFWACSVSDPPENGPKFMMLSPDLSKVALAERGKPIFIWDLNRPQEQQPWRYVWAADATPDRRDQDAWNPAEIVRWHPDGTSIFILYLDTNIIRWNFVEDTQKVKLNTEAREMVISKDGNAVLTSNSRGTLTVWGLPRFNVVYRLFFEDLVRDLSFSPDGQRIYDSRGSFCNVWEPDVLVRQEDAERDDASSTYESNESSILSDPVISQNDSRRSQVTALAKDHDGQYYCCGCDNGAVEIHETLHGKRVRKVYGHSNYVSVIALEWSKSGKYIVSGDDAGRIICKRLEPKEACKWGVFPVLDVRIQDPVLQFLFHPSEALLLISTESSDIVWSIRGKVKKEIVRKTWPHFTGRRWIANPQDPSQLLWVDLTNTYAFSWETLERVGSEPTDSATSTVSEVPARPALPHTASGAPGIVRCISATRSARHLLVEVVAYTGTTRSLVPRGLEVHLVHLGMPSARSMSAAPRRTPLPALAALSVRILGFHLDRVLFLDKKFWLCSWDLADMNAVSVKKHFFLPRDWVTPVSAALVMCNAHGTVFCPRDGDVAIVRNGMRA